MLFLTEDNSFRGEDTSISLDEVVEATEVPSLMIYHPFFCINSWRTCHGENLMRRSRTATCSQMKHVCFQLPDLSSLVQGMSGVQP